MSLCPACVAANPAAHSLTPSGPWELALAAVGLAIVVFALLPAVKLLFRPGEGSPDHVKRAILDDSAPPPRKA